MLQDHPVEDVLDVNPLLLGRATLRETLYVQHAKPLHLIEYQSE
jgi:hypothetical protein